MIFILLILLVICLAINYAIWTWPKRPERSIFLDRDTGSARDDLRVMFSLAWQLAKITMIALMAFLTLAVLLAIFIELAAK